MGGIGGEATIRFAISRSSFGSPEDSSTGSSPLTTTNDSDVEVEGTASEVVLAVEAMAASRSASMFSSFGDVDEEGSGDDVGLEVRSSALT